MKKSFVFLFTMFIASLSMMAQDKAGSTGDSIVFEKTSHDYGSIEQGSDGICEFIFINKGKSSLILNNVRATCGCTVPEWPNEPILPGKTGIIKVKYNTAIIGSFNKSIIVYSNASNSRVILTIKGNVIPKQ